MSDQVNDKLISADLSDLELLDAMYAKRDAFALRKQEAIAAAIPPEIKELLDTIEAEFMPLENYINEDIEALEMALKEQAINSMKTLESTNFNVVFTRGGYSVSAKEVLGLANRWEKTNPEFASELRSILTVKKSSASIRPKG